MAGKHYPQPTALLQSTAVVEKMLLKTRLKETKFKDRRDITVLETIAKHI